MLCPLWYFLLSVFLAFCACVVYLLAWDACARGSSGFCHSCGVCSHVSWRRRLADGYPLGCSWGSMTFPFLRVLSLCCFVLASVRSGPLSGYCLVRGASVHCLFLTSGSGPSAPLGSSRGLCLGVAQFVGPRCIVCAWPLGWVLPAVGSRVVAVVLRGVGEEDALYIGACPSYCCVPTVFLVFYPRLWPQF